MNFSEKVYQMAKILEDKNADNILLIDVSGATIIADAFIVCSGLAVPHVKNLADELEEGMEALGENKLRIEGYGAGRWIVLDYGDILVHIFHREEREFYNIERLWTSEGNSEKYCSTV